MKQSEFLQALFAGKKITHTKWPSCEYIYFNGEDLVCEQGCPQDLESFFEVFPLDGYSLWKRTDGELFEALLEGKCVRVVGSEGYIRLIDGKLVDYAGCPTTLNTEETYEVIND